MEQTLRRAFLLGVRDGLEKAAAYEVRDLSAEDITKYKIKKYRLKKGREAKIVLSGGKFAGFAAYDPLKKELTGLWVHPKHRRQGVGKTLLGSFSGKPSNLVVEKKNQRAQSFYEALGFKNSGKRIGSRKHPVRKYRYERQAGV